MALENVLPAGADTLLTISGLGGFKYQARGLRQKFYVIKEAIQLKRTINGVLTDISNPAFRLYGTKIVVPSDVNAPPLDNLWPGAQITINSAGCFSYLNGNPGSPGREAVTGSMYEENGYTFYQPVLTCLVVEPDLGDFDEWGCAYTWGLQAEEIGPANFDD
jgi:hypothetical protein